MFRPQAWPNDGLVALYDTSQGRAINPLGNDFATAGIGRAEAFDTERADVDQWGNAQYKITQPDRWEGGALQQAGRGDRAPLPWDRAARFFVAFFMHAPYQGSGELRENLGGHMIIRRMPNAGQAQGGMTPLQPLPNQQRTLPPHWDRSIFLAANPGFGH